MHRSNKSAFFNIYHLVADFIALLLSYCVAYNVTLQFTKLHGIMEYTWLIVVYVPVWICIMCISGMYNTTTFNYYDRIFKYSLCSSIFSSVLIGILMYAVKDSMSSGLLSMNFFFISFILMLLEKYITLYLIKLPSSEGIKQVIVIGVQSMYDQFNYYIKKTNIQMNVIKYISVDKFKEQNDGDDHLSLEGFQQELKNQVVDEIIFALPINYFKEMKEYVLACEEMGITARILLDLLNTKFSRVYVASLGTLPMITFHTVSLNNLQLFIKRIMDIIGALVGIILSSVIWIITAIAIKIDSPGPIFYSQDRVGRNGRLFKVYKFRSMYIDAETKKKEMLSQNEVKDGLMFKIKKDPRITRVGAFIRKTSIDELPQFINVLKGEMSLVGTRPPTIDEVNRYKNYHRRRISIKPGITGMWQVNGRSSITDFEQVVNLDTKYIDEWSIWLDIKILMKTIIVVLFKKGAY
ncbi:MAG: sugar transferase [Bacillota bacterium]|nr:sugar transferase [Bacillota bacterium]